MDAINICRDCYLWINCDKCVRINNSVQQAKAFIQQIEKSSESEKNKLLKQIPKIFPGTSEISEICNAFKLIGEINV